MLRNNRNIMKSRKHSTKALLTGLIVKNYKSKSSSILKRVWWRFWKELNQARHWRSQTSSKPSAKRSLWTTWHLLYSRIRFLYCLATMAQGRQQQSACSHGNSNPLPALQRLSESTCFLKVTWSTWFSSVLRVIYWLRRWLSMKIWCFSACLGLLKDQRRK